MGDLKELREQQESLVTRAKGLNHQLVLAGLGGYSLVETEVAKLAEKYAAAGSDVLGDAAADKARALLVARGLFDSAVKLDVKSLTTEVKEFWQAVPEKRRSVYEQCVAAGRGEAEDDAHNELAMAGVGAWTRVCSKGQSFFNDLVSAGSARQG